MHTAEYIELGVIQRTQGLRGNLVVKLHDDAPHFDSMSSLFIRIGHTLVPYRVERFFRQYRKAILKLRGVDDPKAAYALQSRPIFVSQVMQPHLSTQGRHLDRLLGYHVSDTQEGSLGTVQAIYTPPQQKLLAIAYQGRELLVPYHAEIVIHVDHAQQTILVCLPSGFIKAMFWGNHFCSYSCMPTNKMKFLALKHS